MTACRVAALSDLEKQLYIRTRIQLYQYRSQNFGRQYGMNCESHFPASSLIASASIFRSNTMPVSQTDLATSLPCSDGPWVFLNLILGNMFCYVIQAFLLCKKIPIARNID